MWRSHWQRKFVDLAGTSESQGDLKSVVLHKLTLASQKSSFPVALGVRITGVDDSTFSMTGEAYSTIALPHADTHVSKVLQSDDTALGAPLPVEPPPALTEQRCASLCAAYEFARKFPG